MNRATIYCTKCLLQTPTRSVDKLFVTCTKIAFLRILYSSKTRMTLRILKCSLEDDHKESCCWFIELQKSCRKEIWKMAFAFWLLFQRQWTLHDMRILLVMTKNCRQCRRFLNKFLLQRHRATNVVCLLWDFAKPSSRVRNTRQPVSVKPRSTVKLGQKGRICTERQSQGCFMLQRGVEQNDAGNLPEYNSRFRWYLCLPVLFYVCFST